MRGRKIKQKKTQPLLRNFSKPSSISTHLKCIICYEVFWQPRRTYCGHTFCNNCLQDSLKVSHFCPFCRSQVNRKDIGFDRIAQNIIGQLQVLCPSEQCPWKGQCQYLQLHIDNQCQYKQQEKKTNEKSNKTLNKQKAQEFNNVNLNQQNDEEVTQKINQNTMKGSLQARIKFRNNINLVQKTREKQNIQKKSDSIAFLQQLFE